MKHLTVKPLKKLKIGYRRLSIKSYHVGYIINQGKISECVGVAYSPLALGRVLTIRNCKIVDPIPKSWRAEVLEAKDDELEEISRRRGRK